MSVIELEQAISRFAEWFEEFRADEWDKQIERDVAAGKLDHIIRKVDEAIAAGHCKPL
jgi:hypothetical protein